MKVNLIMKRHEYSHTRVCRGRMVVAISAYHH